MSYGLSGKIALVTGAAQGIGGATAHVFAKYGANLILCDKNYEQLLINENKIKEAYPEIETIAIKADLSKYEDVKKVVREGCEKFYQIDVLANCAGICIASKIVDCEEELWDVIMDTNLKSVYMMSKEVLKVMIDKKVKGSIVSISSQASKIGEYANAPYSCSKAAINALTQALAQETAEYGITVNAVCPGYVDTKILQRVFEERGPIEGMTAEEYKQKLCSRIPLERLARPEEIGEFIAFLASDKAVYITGDCLTIAGGSTLI